MRLEIGEGHRADAADARSLTESHKRLLAAAWPMTSRIVRAAQREFGVEAHEVFIALVDLRGIAGRAIAVWTLDERAVAERLARIGTSDIVPLAVPLPLGEGAAVIGELAPALGAAFTARPRGHIPVFVLDADDVAGLAFRPRTALLGEG